MIRPLASIGLILALNVLVMGQAPAPARFGFGEPAPRDLIAALDSDVRPDGIGLPSGEGTPAEGSRIYTRLCATCHGRIGEGGVADPLVGPEPKGFAPFGPEYERWRNGRPDVAFTIGNYWPYATTLFDYIRRAMPPSAPGTLSADEIYSVVAWLLAENEVIPNNAVMNAETLPQVLMPARQRFVPDNRVGGSELK